jgi:hypothetical protein
MAAPAHKAITVMAETIRNIDGLPFAAASHRLRGAYTNISMMPAG